MYEYQYFPMKTCIRTEFSIEGHGDFFLPQSGPPPPNTEPLGDPSCRGTSLGAGEISGSVIERQGGRASGNYHGCCSIVHGTPIIMK